MKTNQSFINEYVLIDNVNECLYECQKDVTVALYEYNNAIRNLEMKSLFESVDTDVLMEKESEGFLARIGNSVLKVIHTIAEFIKNITETILGNTKLIKSDEERVNKIIAEHPELKKQICHGIKEEWFTYKDIAAFEKDIIGLVNMLEKKAIDNETFKDKVKKAIDKFNDSGKTIIATTATITGLLGIVPKVHKSCKEGKDTVSSMSSTLSKFKDNFEKNYGEHDQNVITSAFNALSQMVGLTTKECNDRVAGQSFISRTFDKFCNSAFGKAMKLDDSNRQDRHVAVSNKLEVERNKKEKAKSEKEAADKQSRRDKIDQDIEDEVYKNEQRKKAGLSTKTK